MPKERLYKTVEDFEAVVDAFIAECEAGNIPRPSDYRFCIFSGISSTTLSRYYNGDNIEDNNNIQGDNKGNIYKGFGNALKKLIDYRADRLTGIAEDNPKAATAAIFQLKQKHNGGYTDKQTIDTSSDVAINVTLKQSSGGDFKR